NWLDGLTDEFISRSGHPDAETLVDWFLADYGGGPWQTVMLIDFTHAEAPNILPKLPGEPEAVDREALKGFGGENRQADLERHRKRRERWERQSLSIRLAALEADSERYGLDRELARVRSAIEAAEAKKLRRAA